MENAQLGKDLLFCSDKIVMPWTRKIQASGEKNIQTNKPTTQQKMNKQTTTKQTNQKLRAQATLG